MIFTLQVSLDAEDIRDEKVKVLRSMRQVRLSKQQHGVTRMQIA